MRRVARSIIRIYVHIPCVGAWHVDIATWCSCDGTGHIFDAHRLVVGTGIAGEPDRQPGRAAGHAARAHAAHGAQPDVRAAHAQLQRVPGGQRVRDARGERRHRAAGPVPVVAARRPSEHRRAEQERGRAPGPRHRVVPQRQLPRHVHHTRAPQVHQGLARQAAGHVAGGALPGGGEAARPAAGPRRQIPCAQEVPAATHHMGRRAEDALLQGAHAQPAPRVVPPGPVPEPHQEEGTGPGHRAHSHASGQLVQEPSAT